MGRFVVVPCDAAASGILVKLFKEFLEHVRVVRELREEIETLKALVDQQARELAAYDILVGLLRKGYDA